MVFEDFNQVAVRPQIDITFASALRTVLRQDPDIIMVGEIRDSETADHAVQAALTGHLVLSTLHTNDAPSSITRLLDLGRAALPDHHHPHRHPRPAPGARELHALPGGVRAHRGGGRPAAHATRRSCRRTASSAAAGACTAGRPATAGAAGIFEVLPMSDKMRALVTAQAGAQEIFKAAREEGMRTLREAAIEKVFRGITTTTEMVRVTGK